MKWYEQMDHIWASLLQPNERLVALAMLRFADVTGGRIWPSQARLARMCGLSQRQTQRVMRSLEGRGIFAPVAGDGGGRLPVIYAYHPELVPHNPDVHVAPPTTPVTRPTTQSTRRGDTSVRGRGDASVVRSPIRSPMISHDLRNAGDRPTVSWTPEQIKADDAAHGVVPTGYLTVKASDPEA